jgi:hypothetical protein
MFSMTAPHVAFETAPNSEIASINWDLVILVIVFPYLKLSGLELMPARSARSARPNPNDVNCVLVHLAAALAIAQGLMIHRTLDGAEIDSTIERRGCSSYLGNRHLRRGDWCPNAQYRPNSFTQQSRLTQDDVQRRNPL